MKKIDLQWHSAAHSCLEQLGGDQIVWLESHNIFTIMPEVLDLSLYRDTNWLHCYLYLVMRVRREDNQESPIIYCWALTDGCKSHQNTTSLAG